MFDWLNAAYDWIKAAHVIAVISWMAGMLYLPRLFVYHCEAPKGSPQSETFKVMERRLLKAIINPAMIATWLFGLLLVWLGGWYLAPWFHAKFVLVLIMSVIHGLYTRYVREFAEDRNTRSQKFYRIINEIPTVLMVGIVILVIVKPFYGELGAGRSLQGIGRANILGASLRTQADVGVSRSAFDRPPHQVFGPRRSLSRPNSRTA